jgi:type IV fimbrial biogenesis protein FimT
MDSRTRFASVARLRRCQDCCAGFTLVELLVTIAIAAILMGVAVPSFSTFIATQRIKTAAFDLTSTLIQARSEALKRNASVTLASATGGWQNGWVLNAGSATLSQHEALAGMAVAGPVGTLTFNSNGRLSTSGNTFSVSSSVNTSVAARCVSVALSGIPASKAGSC